jgi:hypothetical protein
MFGLAAGGALAEKAITMTHSRAADHDRDVAERELDDTTQNPLRESGIPPAHLRPSRGRLVDRTAESIEAALAESARTEANLNLLLRGLEQIVAGAAASRDSNSMLSRELDSLRDVLARSSAEEMALRQRVRLLEQAVERARRDAALERAFFLEQEDAFLAEILTDHEREVAELRRRLMDALTRAAPPTPGPRQSGTTARTMRVDSEPIRQAAPETVPPPGSGEVAVVRLGALRIPRPTPSEQPPSVVQKPAASRPSGGYSLRDGEVAEERVETPSSSRRT